MLPLDGVVARSARHAGGDLLPNRLLVRRGPAARPLVALTFDDGPDDHTLALLALLDDLTLPATFFLVGERAHRRRDLVDAIVARGHELGLHGWAHRNPTLMSPIELAADLDRTERALPPMPSGLRLFRPPRGRVSLRSLGVTAALGYTTVLWSIDSLDSRPIGPRAIENHVVRSGLRAGDIVLLHEGEAATRAALPAIAELVKRSELVPATMSSLLGVRPVG